MNQTAGKKSKLKWISIIGKHYEEERITDVPIDYLYIIKEEVEEKVAKGETLTKKEADLYLFFQNEKVQKRMYWTRRKKEVTV
ncbi:MAG: hypothetical protein ACI94Y_003311 [Maribacter sp.]|jgi:hypothetical protein